MCCAGAADNGVWGRAVVPSGSLVDSRRSRARVGEVRRDEVEALCGGIACGFLPLMKISIKLTERQGGFWDRRVGACGTLMSSSADSSFCTLRATMSTLAPFPARSWAMPLPIP